MKKMIEQTTGTATEIDIEETVLINISFSKIGLNRKGDVSKIETDCDKTRATFGKKLFSCPEIAAIGTHDYETARFVKARVSSERIMPGVEGIYILAVSFVKEVETFLMKREGERAILIEAFCNVYNEQREEARRLLASQFREQDFPTDPRPKFKMSWRWLSFGVPKEMEAATPEEYQEAVRLFKDDMSAALNGIAAELARQMQDLVSHLQERLTPGADGKKKIFRDTVTENLEEFLTLIDKRNITKNTDLKAITAKAREIIAATTPEKLRESGATRAKIAGDMREIKEQLTALITTKTSRKFDLE